jgi:hypothetical protein
VCWILEGDKVAPQTTLSALTCIVGHCWDRQTRRWAWAQLRRPAFLKLLDPYNWPAPKPKVVNWPSMAELVGSEGELVLGEEERER